MNACTAYAWAARVTLPSAVAIQASEAPDISKIFETAPSGSYNWFELDYASSSSPRVEALIGPANLNPLRQSSVQKSISDNFVRTYGTAFELDGRKKHFAGSHPTELICHNERHWLVTYCNLLQ